jgi:hypothetical protein
MFARSGRKLSRRTFVGLGVGAAWAGTRHALPGVARAASPTPRAKQVLVVFEQGGLSHIDTWDPKPEAIAEHRSPYKPIDTAIPGVQFTELLSHTAKQADKLAVVRSMYHKVSVSGHPDGTQYLLSGARPGGPVLMPDLGTVVATLIGSPCGYLPPYIMAPGNGEQSYNTSPGFLSPGLQVFKTTGNDLSDPSWRVPDLRLLDGIDLRRFGDRRDLLSSLNLGLVSTAGEHATSGADPFYRQAYNLLTDARTQAAFDLASESDALRDRYGRGHRGQCYLLGRRLVERGVRFVVLDVREPETDKAPGGFNMNWDHHDLIYTPGSCGTIRNKAGGEGRYGISHWCMMGSTDRAFAALLADMDERGLLADTLVCFVTEFGRTPRLNNFQGRDHWTNAYSIAFAGAGVRGGQVIGRTDRDGGHVLERGYTPDDFAATVLECLGIDREQPLFAPDGRPIFLAKEGEPIRELTS